MLSLPSLDTLPTRWQPYRDGIERAADGEDALAHLPAQDRAGFEQDFAAAVGMPWAAYNHLRRAAAVLARHSSEGGAELAVSRIDTPLGEMLAVFAEAEGLSLLEFADQSGVDKELAAVQQAFGGRFVWRECPASALLRQELAAYFQGRLKNFSVPLRPVGTAFQRRVWAALQTIPYGSTLSYKQQAERLGDAKAVRAVAAANGQNKISIIIPCHRVIGSNGKLTGYAGGLFRKQYLLNLEQQDIQTALFAG
ncbi:methylated-DNA--[protein]-cysteine S-methyltransferase [Bergeriella denitrificans]|uniref:Methylated-DNA--protein-cysteine methyltransferase n=1 Tax=Bergeriella denitrificans TaxID=494 RepID=A0A378UFG3_BERDE|nr:methylated-DNA--[protein]-cysteine S-methyltransferase [Bergeriella denitrificans]STZ75483.1 methylated-DNA--protein-cysteine methyltransferase [Bergeriella denitrificans]